MRGNGMNRKKQIDRIGRVGNSISRRDFIRYSSLAITTAAMPKMLSCSSYQPRQDCLIREVQPVPEEARKKVFESSRLGGVKMAGYPRSGGLKFRSRRHLNSVFD